MEASQIGDSKKYDDKITLTVLIPGYKFLIYKKVIQNISSLNNEIVSEHFPELNIK